MKKEAFIEGANKYGDFYLYYPKDSGGKVTYLVGTLNLDVPYIKERIGNKLKAAKEGYVNVWSWTSNKLRVINLNKVLYIKGLTQELKRCKKPRLKRTRT